MVKEYYSNNLTTLYLGDCRDVTLLGTLITDPPYGINLTNHDKDRSTRGLYSKVHGDDNREVGMFVVSEAERLGLPTVVFASPMKPWPGKWRQHLVWDKGGAVGGGGDTKKLWKLSWELIQVARTPALSGGRDEAVLNFKVGRSQFKLHPTQKPLDLMLYLIWKTTTENSTVCDPFAGSGTTLLAAQRLGRKSVGVEIEEQYCEIAAKRLEDG